jgi:RimJ/RimL family protein N-acetyltransferase
MGTDRERGYAELGYWTAAPARRRGATARAVMLVRDWAAGELGLTELEILAHRDNVPSQRVAERAGFGHSGELRASTRMPAGRREGYLVYRWRAPQSSRSRRAPGAT